MNEKMKLLRAIGDIDDDIIDDAASNTGGSKKGRWMRAVAAAACVAIVGIGATVLIKQPDGGLTASGDHLYPVKNVYIDRQQASGGETEGICHVPLLEDMTDDARYVSAEYNGVEYTTRMTELGTSVMTRIGDAVLRGHDVYTDTDHTIDAEVYSIEGVSAVCAVAVKPVGNDKYYVYVNSSYKPETLGDLIDDLDLHSNMSFGPVYMELSVRTEYSGLVEFSDVDEAAIWEMLLSDVTPVAIYDRVPLDGLGGVLRSISVDIPLLGYKNISLTVTEDGYLWTNILDIGKAFYIGREKAEAFADYVDENYTGYELRYIYEDGEDARETLAVGEKTPAYDPTE